MNNNINQLIEFLKFTHEIRNVKRAILLETNSTNENDSEHMYQLALVAWFLIENDNLKLDKFRAVGMALVHDVVEVYSGDIPSYAPEYKLPGKAKKEKIAALKLKKQWPQFPSMHELINEYEERKTPESKFIYSLDKLMPLINNYLYGGRIWKKHDLDLRWVKDSKAGKIDQFPEVNDYYKKMLAILEKRPELFGVSMQEQSKQ